MRGHFDFRRLNLAKREWEISEFLDEFALLRPEKREYFVVVSVL